MSAREHLSKPLDGGTDGAPRTLSALPCPL